MDITAPASDYVTIHDLTAASGVSDRTIRAWITKGYLPRPFRHSLGKGKGVQGRYPAACLQQVRLLSSPLRLRQSIYHEGSIRCRYEQVGDEIVIHFNAES